MSDLQYQFYSMSSVKSMVWGPGCDSVCMLSSGISVAKQTEPMYGAGCNNHTPQ